MKEKVIYLAVFMNEADLPKGCLDRKITDPHVTIAYKPASVPWHLFGRQVAVTVTGYGNDGRNEGLLVDCKAKNPDVQKALDSIRVKHITISVAADSKPVYTADLEFKPVEPYTIYGTVGGFTADRRVVTEP